MILKWFGWCEPAEEDLDRFVFRNGTTVWALGWDEAIEKLETIDTRNFWATETEPGTWIVQFEARDDPRVTVKVRGVESGSAAARHARWFLERDAREQQLRGC